MRTPRRTKRPADQTFFNSMIVQRTHEWILLALQTWALRTSRRTFSGVPITSSMQTTKATYSPVQEFTLNNCTHSVGSSAVLITSQIAEVACKFLGDDLLTRLDRRAETLLIDCILWRQLQVSAQPLSTSETYRVHSVDLDSPSPSRSLLSFASRLFRISRSLSVWR